MNTKIREIAVQFHHIHRGRNWFGQSYRTKLQDMDPEQYFIRPAADVHSVAELITHATAWRKDAVVKIRTGAGQLTEASDEDWPDLELLQEKGWATIIAEYEESVDGLIGLLEEKDDAFLETTYHDPEFGGNFPYSFTIYGILQHDIYHLGQLGLVASMLKKK
ncbi:MAG: DinB family protein [Flavobacteriaceae bacterium]